MSTIATFSIRNHSRDLAIKYVLYEYLEYFKDDPEMLELVASNQDVPLSTFTPTSLNVEFASARDIKLNNILAEIGDSVEIPKNKKNNYKKNPFVSIPTNPAETPIDTMVHPSLSIYSHVCTALDVANAEKTKKDRASLGLTVASAWDGTKHHGTKFTKLNHFIATPALDNYNDILAEYGFAATTDGDIFDENGRHEDPYICGADRSHCDDNLNDVFFRMISSDEVFEEQNSILQRKLIMLPALRLLDQHRTGQLVHGNASGEIENRPSTPEERLKIVQDVFMQTFMSVTPPVFDKTSGVLEFFLYIGEKLNQTVTTTTGQ